MFGPTQVAASISTRVVSSDTSEICPPITPPMPDGPSASHTSVMLESRVRSTSSSVVIFSPSRARLTSIRLPRTRSRSYACTGWPIASIT